MGFAQLDRAGIYARQSKGNAKSIADQLTECREDSASEGWEVAAEWSDRVSASRYTTKVRDEWPKVLAAIEAGELDVLVLWESSRGDRDAETWLGLLRRCRTGRVRIRITSHERTYNLAMPADWKSLATEGIDSAYESDKLSLRVLRSAATAARAGRPAVGPTPYGYRRTYDPATGHLEGQKPNPDTAPIVREVFERVAKAVPLSEICRDLNARHIPAPKGGTWRRLRLRSIILNPAYIGLRKHKGETYPAGWEPIVGEATFYAAGRVLNDPTRLAKARPGRQVHLLTYLGICDVCDGPLRAREIYYHCTKGCINIRREMADDFVREVIIARLSRKDAYTALRQEGAESDREVLAAEGEEARLRGELDGWRLSAARGNTTPESLAVIEADLTRRIAEAARRAKEAAMPPALRAMLEPGADVRTRWQEATVNARREVIRILAEVRVSPAGQNAFIPVEQRLSQSRWVGDTRTWGEVLM